MNFEEADYATHKMYLEGREAAHKGHGQEENPYEYDTIEFYEWRNGWWDVMVEEY